VQRPVRDRRDGPTRRCDGHTHTSIHTDKHHTEKQVNTIIYMLMFATASHRKTLPQPISNINCQQAKHISHNKLSINKLLSFFDLKLLTENIVDYMYFNLQMSPYFLSFFLK